MNHKKRFQPVLPLQRIPRPFPSGQVPMPPLKSPIDDRIKMAFVRKCSREKNITLKWICSSCRKTNTLNPMYCSYCRAPKREFIHLDPGTSIWIL